MSGSAAGEPAGVPGRGGDPGDAGEPVRGLNDCKVSAGGAEELGGEYGSEAEHAEQGLRVPVFGDLLADQRIEVG